MYRIVCTRHIKFLKSTKTYSVHSQVIRDLSTRSRASILVALIERTFLLLLKGNRQLLMGGSYFEDN